MDNQDRLDTNENTLQQIPSVNLLKPNQLTSNNNLNQTENDETNYTETEENKWSQYNEVIVQYEFPDLDEWQIIRKEKTDSHMTTVHWARIILFNYYYNWFIIACLMYALFDNRADTLFDILNGAVLFVFLIDFIVNLIAGFEYLISFHFWMDLASIIILIFDFSSLREEIFKSDNRPNKKAAYNTYVVLEVLRIIRIISLSRIFFRKKFKNRKDYLKNKLYVPESAIDNLISNKKLTSLKDLNGEQQRLTQRSSNLQGRKTSIVHRKTGAVQVKLQQTFKRERLQESKISRRMIYLTNKRLMMVLLFMLIFIPMFSTFFWTDVTYAYETDMNFIVIFFKQNTNQATSYIENDLIQKYKDFHLNLLSIDMPYVYTQVFDSGEYLRQEELRQHSGDVIYEQDDYNQVGTIKVSVRTMVRIQAFLNILRIIVIILLFLIGIYHFTKDARERILDHLERMLAKVRAMAENPSKALALSKNDKTTYNSDIAIIDETIQKIAYLLVLGFGEAGNSLLSKILYTKEFEIDFLSEAHTIYGIYGFCDIRNFTDATEILTEDVLLFVNAIAEVVHSEVGASEGGANKNIGDAFLVVWKLIKDESDIESKIKRINVDADDDYYYVPDLEKRHEKYHNNQYNTFLTESALISFLKIISRITVDKNITEYNKNEKLIKALPGFKVNLGFGLHIGWSIEGAIGSRFKIDMSYLSPNVNMSSRLEGLTKDYKKPLLFTNSVYNLINSSKIRSLCRKIDVVQVIGSKETTEIFTIEINVDRLRQKNLEHQIRSQKSVNQLIMKQIPKENLVSCRNMRFDKLPKNFKALLQEEEIKLSVQPDEDKLFTEFLPYNQIEKTYEKIIIDKNLIYLLELDEENNDKRINQEYIKSYNEAIQFYQNKQWKEAVAKFQQAKIILDQHNEELKKRGRQTFEDETCMNVVLNYIKQQEPDDDWLGRKVK